jgi:DNA-3-methyladenine glycosylase II
MWFQTPKSRASHRAAMRTLRLDPVMRRLIKRVGPCTLSPRKDYFVVLCKSIYTQQISTRIAAILFGRFCECFPRKRPTPTRVVELLSRDGEDVKRCGLSRQKRAYLIDLAKHFADNRIPTHRLKRMSDEEVIECLTAVKGVGRWTAEMFLIFVLNRSDIWPVDDLGLQEGVKLALKLPHRPMPKELREIGQRWKPYRTLATWYLWRNLGLESQKRSKK